MHRLADADGVSGHPKAPDERPDLYGKRSPITHVDDVGVPLLVIQRTNDPRVPRSEAERLVASLGDREIGHEYLLFEEEGHGVVRTENRVEYIMRTVEFFRSRA